MMILWSPVPEEFIFEGFNEAKYNWIETEVQGVKMLVEPLSDQPGYATVIRLLCPNPQSYLNPKFQPGQKVCLIKMP
jgi:hypothetical protein